MRLQAQTPSGMIETIIHREADIFVKVGVVKGLQEEVPETETVKRCRVEAVLGVNKLQFVTRPKPEISAGLGAYADPIDTGWRLQRAVGFDGDLEIKIM